MLLSVISMFAVSLFSMFDATIQCLLLYKNGLHALMWKMVVSILKKYSMQSTYVWKLKWNMMLCKIYVSKC